MAYPKIIAVDFDGTLCENAWPKIGKPKYETIRYIKQQQLEGAKIILWTCRSGEMLGEAVNWCYYHHGIIFDAINANLPYIIEKFGGDTRKIFANEYIDDKNGSIATTNTSCSKLIIKYLINVFLFLGVAYFTSLCIRLFGLLF